MEECCHRRLPGQRSPKKLSPVAEVPVRVSESGLCDALPCSGRENREGESGAGEQPPQHHPSSSHLLEQSNTKSGHAFFHRAGAFWVTCGWGGAGGLPHTRCAVLSAGQGWLGGSKLPSGDALWLLGCLRNAALKRQSVEFSWAPWGCRRWFGGMRHWRVMRAGNRGKSPTDPSCCKQLLGG